jgi:hypothetical protein
MTIHHLPPHGLPQSWASLLARADSEADVVGVVRDFVAQLTPDELVRLPKDFRPGRFGDGEDVADFALNVKVHNLGTSEADREPGLQARITAFFSSAAERVAQLSRNAEHEQQGRSA